MSGNSSCRTADAADVLPEYKPSAFYFRRALRRAKTKDDAVEVGMQVVRELEHIKEWARSLGMIPPKRFILQSEMDDKNLRRFGADRLHALSTPEYIELGTVISTPANNTDLRLPENAV